MKPTPVLWLMASVMLTSTTCTLQPHGAELVVKRSATELSPADTFPTSLHAGGPSNGRENIYEDGPGRPPGAPSDGRRAAGCLSRVAVRGAPRP